MVTLNLIEGYAGYGRRRRRSLTKHLVQTRAYKAPGSDNGQTLHLVHFSTKPKLVFNTSLNLIIHTMRANTNPAETRRPLSIPI